MEPAAQQTSRTPIEVEQNIRQLNDEWVKAIFRADAEALERIMSDGPGTSDLSPARVKIAR